DDEEGGAERRKKAKARKRRQAWKKSGTGVFLNFISLCSYTGAWGIFLLIYTISMIQVLTKSMPGGGFFSILGYLADGLMVLCWVLFVVGGAFILLSPGRHGEMGLGIATLSVSSIVLIFYLYCRFALDFDPAGFLGGLGMFGGGRSAGLSALVYFFPMLE